MKWTDQRVKKFKRLYSDNLSYRRIADELGGFEHCRDGGRNACIGQAGRLNLPKREWVDGVARSQRSAAMPRHKTARTRAARIEAEAQRRQKALDQLADALEATDVAPDQSQFAVTFMELERHHCRWPMGTPGTPEFRFCGTQKFEESPYCARHHRMAYTKPQPRQPRPYNFREAAE